MFSIICFILMLISLGILIYARLQHIFVLIAIFKTLCSLLFLGVAFFAQKECPKSKPTTYFKRIFVGLSLCALCDFFLIFNSDNGLPFILGVGSCAVAHILFASSFFLFGKLRIADFVWTALFSIILFFLITNKKLIHSGDMTAVLCIYATIISFMVAKSFTLWQYHTVNRYFVFMTIGATVLFIISDTLLLFAYFSAGGPNNLEAVDNIVYYISVGMFGLSFKKELLQKN